MNIEKYNYPVPRYTSYPTVPYWDNENFDISGYEKTLQTAFWQSSKEVSIYLHLPFCESLCTYCACNTRITRDHNVEQPYIVHLLKEWELYLERLPEKPTIREIHLGGGTPTFFSAKNLEMLLENLMKQANVSPNTSFSFEGHPANTTTHHLQLLHNFGFDRLSLGIQDFDLDVQKLINRMQSFDQVRNVTEKAREIGYQSINYDMVYGLPGQTKDSLTNTLEQINVLKPDRIAYYSYAHVPTLRPAQKSYEQFLPAAEEKYELMQQGKQFFETHDYEEIGMDHYVLPSDELVQAKKSGELHRNFMGYTPFTSNLLIGLGVSAISDSWTGFAQNEKVVESYYQRIEKGQLPIVRGHLLDREDLFLRQQILNLMCKFETSWHEQELLDFGLTIHFDLLEQLADEGFVEMDGTHLRILPPGKQILRNICSAFDARLSRSGRHPQFSQSI